MAQSVSIVISSTTPKVSISITENSRNLFAYVGGGNGLVFIPSQTSLDLTQAASTVAIQTETAGISGQFTYAQIATFTIDGVDQLATATNLSLVIDACAPFFFDGVKVVEYTLVSGDTSIDYALCKGADIVYLKTSEAAPTTFTISKILNLPIAHKAIFFVRYLEANITRVDFTSTGLAGLNAHGQISRSVAATIQLEPKNEFVEAFGFVYNSLNLCSISSSYNSNA